MDVSWSYSHSEFGCDKSVTTRGPAFVGCDDTLPQCEVDVDGSADRWAYPEHHRGRRAAAATVFSSEWTAPPAAAAARASQAGAASRGLDAASGVPGCIRPSLLSPFCQDAPTAAAQNCVPSPAACESLVLQERFAGEVRILQAALTAATNSVCPTWLQGPGNTVEQEIARRKHIVKISRLREKLIIARARLDAAWTGECQRLLPPAASQLLSWPPASAVAMQSVPAEVVTERYRKFGDRVFWLWVEDCTAHGGIRVHATDTASLLDICTELKDTAIQEMFNQYWDLMNRSGILGSSGVSHGKELVDFLGCLLESVYFEVDRERNDLVLRLPPSVEPPSLAERVSANSHLQEPASACNGMLGPSTAGGQEPLPWQTALPPALRDGCPQPLPPRRPRPRSAASGGRAGRPASARGSGGTLLQAARDSVSSSCSWKYGQLTARSVDMARRCMRPSSARTHQRAPTAERRVVEAVFDRLSSAQTESSRAHSASCW